MKTLSTGDESTLGNYRKLCVTIFGEKSAQVEFIDAKIAKSPSGEADEVIADERQMLYLLGSMPARG